MITTVTATISAGQSLSTQASLLGAFGGIAIPATWTPAPISFQESPDGGTTWLVVIRDGNEYTIPVNAGSFVQLDPSFWGSASLIKVQSGSSTAPVQQAVDVELTLVLPF